MRPTPARSASTAGSCDPRPTTLPIAFIHQDLGLVEWMTVAENVALLTGYPRSALGLISWRQVRKAARDALAIMGSDLDPERAGHRRCRPPSARSWRSAGRSR